MAHYARTQDRRRRGLEFWSQVSDDARARLPSSSGVAALSARVMVLSEYDTPRPWSGQTVRLLRPVRHALQSPSLQSPQPHPRIAPGRQGRPPHPGLFMCLVLEFDSKPILPSIEEPPPKTRARNAPARAMRQPPGQRRPGCVTVARSCCPEHAARSNPDRSSPLVRSLTSVF